VSLQIAAEDAMLFYGSLHRYQFILIPVLSNAYHSIDRQYSTDSFFVWEAHRSFVQLMLILWHPMLALSRDYITAPALSSFLIV